MPIIDLFHMSTVLSCWTCPNGMRPDWTAIGAIGTFLGAGATAWCAWAAVKAAKTAIWQAKYLTRKELKLTLDEAVRLQNGVVSCLHKREFYDFTDPAVRRSDIIADNGIQNRFMRITVANTGCRKVSIRQLGIGIGSQ